MYSPVHATAGFFAVLFAPQPWLGLPLAVASHYLLDAVPHGDSGLGPWMTSSGQRHRLLTVESIDLGTAALMVAFLIYQHPEKSSWYLLAGAIGGILPDLLWGTRFLIDQSGAFRALSRLLHIHDQAHTWGHAKPAYDIPFRVGILAQALLLAAVLLLYR